MAVGRGVGVDVGTRVGVGSGVDVGSGVGVAVGGAGAGVGGGLGAVVGVRGAAGAEVAVGVAATATASGDGSARAGCRPESPHAANSRAATTAQTKTTILVNILDERISRIIAYESHTYATLTEDQRGGSTSTCHLPSERGPLGLPMTGAVADWLTPSMAIGLNAVAGLTFMALVVVFMPSLRRETLQPEQPPEPPQPAGPTLRPA